MPSLRGWFGIFTFSPLIKATQDTGPRLVAFIRGTVEAGSSLAFSALRCRAFRAFQNRAHRATLSAKVIAEVAYAQI
jgi:hypothetical protein